MRSSSRKQSKRKRHHWIASWLMEQLLPLVLICFGNFSPRTTRRIARIAVFLARPFLGGKIRIIDANIKVAFPEFSLAQVKNLRRKNLCFMAEFGLDFLHILRHPSKAGDMLCPFQFPKELDNPGQPGIFCAPHLGNWEMAVQFLPAFGRPFIAVAAKFGIPMLNQLLAQTRSATGAEIVEPSGAALKVREGMRCGKFAGILNDQNISPRHGGIFVPFFGLPATTSRLPAALARRENAVMAAFACCKTEDGRFEMLVEPLPKPVSQYEDDWELTAALVTANEALVRKHPEQYLWMYPRWRYVPVNLSEEQKTRFPFYAAHRKYDCGTEMLEAMNKLNP